MNINLRYWPIILMILVFPFYGNSQLPGEKYSAFLNETVKNHDNFWIRVHAGEALVLNNFTINAQQIFHPELESDGSEKIGALRVLARQNQNDSLKYQSLSKDILHQFKIATDEHTRLVALETLGKLGLYFPDEQILHLAQNETGGMKTMAQWVVSNSGKTTELSRLVEFLFSDDSTQFKYASYALRFIKDIPQASYHRMKAKYQELDKSHPSRVYLLSALWIHAPPEDVEMIKKELLYYLNGEVYERYEVYEALAVNGGKEDFNRIKDGFLDENDDVRVAASNAYLTNESNLQNGVGWLDWVILVVYGIFLLGIGWYYALRQKNKEDYFLGGRSASPFISGISLYVSFFSAISYLAIVGEVIKYGPLVPLIAILAAPLIYYLGSYLLIPYFMNLKLISAYEILEKPLGVGVRRIGAVIFLLTRLVWMALLIYLAAKAMVVMMGWNEEYILIITIVLGVITIIYTSMGGLKAVLVTDVIQFIILFLGAIFTIAIVVVKFGSVGVLIPTSWSGNWQKVDFISFDPYIRLTIFFAFINQITWWFCTSGSDQMAIQRFLSTRDLKSARQSFLVTQIGAVSITLVLMLVGFLVMQFYNASPNLLPTGVDADFMFPDFIANQFPAGMSGLVIAALFSASMSSLSSGVNSSSSVFMTDLLPVFSKMKGEVDNLRNIRISSALIGIVVIILSMVIPLIPGNITEVTAKTNGLFMAPLFNLFFMALFMKKAKQFGVVMGSIYGFLAGFIIAFWDLLTGNPPFSFLWIATSSLIISIISSLVINSVFPILRRKATLAWGLILIIPWIVLFYFLIY